MNNLPVGHQNIDNLPDPYSLEGLMSKYNITCDGVDEDGDFQFIGHRDDLRNFFEDREALDL